MGLDTWKVVSAEPAVPGGEATRYFGYDKESARSCAESLDGRLFRKEEVGADEGLMAMSNPSAYGWKEVPL